MIKQKRHSRILKIVKENNIRNQDQLTMALRNEGFEVTQATVSRDIKELNLVKISGGDGGYKYALPNRVKEETSQHINAFLNVITSVDYAMHTVVIKAYAGMAPAIAASLDNIMSQEILGTIAGDDTILVITENPQEAEAFCKKLKRMLGGK